jgi:hypothetical protein
LLKTTIQPNIGCKNYNTFKNDPMRQFISLACLFLLASCLQKDTSLADAWKVSSDVASRYIPDSREDLYQIHFSKKGSEVIATGETTNPEAKKALLSAMDNLRINVIDSIRILPEQSRGTHDWGLVTISVGNIRTGPDHDREMSSQALLGTPVRILDKSGSWSLVQTPDNYIGWLDDAAMFLTDSAGMADWRKAKRVIYLPFEGFGIHPETKEAVTDLVAGDVLKLAEMKKDVTILELPDGRKISIPINDAVGFDEWRNRSNPTAESICSTARNLLGRPYLWGGTSAKGVDCSGFVKTVYFLNGIILARDASLQFRHGIFKDPERGYEQLKTGDLVFFGRKATADRPARATHVGLYLGNGQYINSSGYVKIDSFNPDDINFSKKRADSWLGGRSILGSEGVKGIIRIKDHPWY